MLKEEEKQKQGRARAGNRKKSKQEAGPEPKTARKISRKEAGPEREAKRMISKEKIRPKQKAKRKTGKKKIGRDWETEKKTGGNKAKPEVEGLTMVSLKALSWSSLAFLFNITSWRFFACFPMPFCFRFSLLSYLTAAFG